MIIKSIPLNVCLNATPINSLEPQEKTRKPMRFFDNNVGRCIKDLGDCGHCYCHSRLEIEKVKKGFPKVSKHIKENDVIINGEIYDGMWDLTLDAKYRRRRK